MAEVQLIEPKRFSDDRGWFAEVYNEKTYSAQGIESHFVQDNHSLSRRIGTVRGLHFQAPPHAQAKLVRCLRGRIFDVVVDVRRGSPTYGNWIGTELSAENGRQIFIPLGFLHGFLTLEPDTEVLYKASGFYAPQCEGGIRWDDPLLAIEWPLPTGITPTLSGKDEEQPSFADFDSPFRYEGAPLLPSTEPV